MLLRTRATYHRAKSGDVCGSEKTLAVAWEQLFTLLSICYFFCAGTSIRIDLGTISIFSFLAERAASSQI